MDDLRDGWDLHVEFGLQHPALYLLMYGDPDRSRESPAAAATVAILRELVEAVARAGRLRIDVETAVAMIQSAGVGVVITLIGTQEGDRPAVDLSASVREAILGAAVTAEPAGTDAVPPADDPAVPASTLRAMLPTSEGMLTPGELLLLDELLRRISRSRGGGREL